MATAAHANAPAMMHKSSPIDSYLQTSHSAIYDHRGSISTDRTSASMEDSAYTSVPAQRVRKPIRAKGTYRLDDFIIQRTLGTGSFGRVHLGVYYIFCKYSLFEQTTWFFSSQ
jgi:hypothetical protein